MCVTADRPDPPKRGMGYLFSCPYERNERKNAMTEQPDTSQGWCCDGRTWSEHIHEGDRPILAAMPVSGPVMIVLSVRPAQPRHVPVEHGGHHLQPGPDGQRQQALPRRPGDLGHRHHHLLRHDDLSRPRVRLGTTAVLLVGVSHRCPPPSTDSFALGPPPPPPR